MVDVDEGVQETNMTSPQLEMDWNSGFSVYVEEIDVHQKKMFEIFNELIREIQAKEDNRNVVNLVNDLNDYGKLYFSTEEKILRKRGYPDHEAHARAHRQFIKLAINLRRDMAEEQTTLTVSDVQDLRNWLVTHIQTKDCLYIPFLRIYQYIQNAAAFKK